jgi:hypothetical protein
MQKDTAIGMLMIAGGFGLLLANHALGIDGNILSAGEGLLTAGLGLLGIHGLWPTPPAGGQ